MEWTRLSPIGEFECASANCCSSARWHGVRGDVGSYFCSACKDSIDDLELRSAAKAVLAFDWSDNDADAVAAIERLRKALVP